MAKTETPTEPAEVKAAREALAALNFRVGRDNTKDMPEPQRTQIKAACRTIADYERAKQRGRA